MKKSILLFMTSVAMVLSAVPFGANAEDNDSAEKQAEFSISDGILTSVNLNGETSVVIPDDVITIGAGAFSDCSELMSVVFPEGLEEIGKNAFDKCNLSSVELPESLKVIGKDAFAENTELKEITIPEGVIRFFEPFEGCTSLSDITFKREDDKLVDTLLSSYGPAEDDALYLGLFGDNVSEELCKVFVPDSVYCQYIQVFQNECNAFFIPESMRDKSILDGDVNGDNDVSIADAVKLQNYLIGKDSDILWFNADLVSYYPYRIFKEGRISAFDLIALKKLVINKGIE